jgi:uncharacterized protein (TIGR03083 family)
MAVDPATHLHHLRRDGVGLADAAEAAGLGTDVAPCPGWSVGDLVWHTGEVLSFWSDVVAHRWRDPSGYVEPERPADAELVGWFRTAVDRAVAVLGEPDPGEAAWSWAPGGGTVGWVVRRMAQEVAVHRWDAEHAAGRRWAIDAELASDGIDEFLEHYTGDVAEGAAPLDGSVHLHCTDVEGEWLVTEPDVAGPLAVRREHAKGDAALRGPAASLLLLLWRRAPADDPSVEVIGDVGVVLRLRARADLN